MRSGVDRSTGMILTGWPHCQQSIGVILSTVVGSLLMARDFGCANDLVDRPMTSLPKLVQACAQALKRDEPGFRLTRMTPSAAGADGVITFDIAGDFYPNALEGDFTTVETGVAATIPLGFATQMVAP